MKVKKIVVLPLDERPCNYNFVQLMPKTNYRVVVPPIELMGRKKEPGDVRGLAEWLSRECRDADGAIVAMDTLLYGGIVPSRLHHDETETLTGRAGLLRKIREENPGLKLFGFQLIMRCPSYSSDDEEPDYYETYGLDIHTVGRLEHLGRLNMLSGEDKKELERLLARVDKGALSDYRARRAVNIAALRHSLEMVEDGVFDYFIVPQDDSAPFGFTATDQMAVRGFIKERSLHFKISMYPGADEIAMTLLSRMMCEFSGARPKIWAYYAATNGPTVVPCYEDRIINETIKHQIYACGGTRVYSYAEADLVLAVNIGDGMADINEAKSAQVYDVGRNLTEFVDVARRAVADGKGVTVADVAYANGGDLELLRLLSAEGLLYKLNGYAGWNTSSNTLGTALCEGILSRLEGDDAVNKAFITLRVLEDMCYCAHTRWYLVNEKLPALGLGYFDAGGVRGKVSELVKEEILDFAKKNLPEVYGHVAELDVWMPWARMFEVGLAVRCKGF